MTHRPIITIGASAGGFEALKTLAAGLPDDFDASVFIVWHMSPDVRGVLPQVLNRVGPLAAAHAYDGETVVPRRIYIAPPDRHMILEGGIIRVTRGPKENRFRPAIDPLFRSAALAYGPRVIGVILSGALDDGTAGLYAVKSHGGLAIVQDPMDAEVPSMPRSAAQAVAVDYCVPAADIPALLMRLISEPLPHHIPRTMENDDQLRTEVRIAGEAGAFDSGIMDYGVLTPFTCPECHGVLSALQDGLLRRYRCHTGHAFTADALLAALTENIEDACYSALRGVEESVMLLNHIGDHLAEENQKHLAAAYFKKAKEAEDRAEVLRQAVMKHEHLSVDGIREELEVPGG